MKRVTGFIVVLLLLVSAIGVVAGADTKQTIITPTGKEVEVTEEQRAELNEISKQMLAVRKQLIQKYIDYGWITEEQGGYLLERLELQEKYAGKLGLFGRGLRFPDEVWGRHGSHRRTGGFGGPGFWGVQPQ